MKFKMLFSVLVFSAFFFTCANAQKTESGTALIISTTSKAELDKIKESLKDADPSTYRINVTTMEGGKAKTTVLGSAPLASVNKIKGATTITPGKGGFAASDIVILVKNITSSGTLRSNVLKQLDTKLSSSAAVNFDYKVSKSALEVTKIKQ